MNPFVEFPTHSFLRDAVEVIRTEESARKALQTGTIFSSTAEA